MILRENLTQKYFRLIYLPIHFLIEIALTVLFLVMPFFILAKSLPTAGYATAFGIILASVSIILAVGIFYLFICGFNFKKEQAQFLYNEKSQRIIIIGIIFLLLARIGVLAISFLYQVPFASEHGDRTVATLVLIGVSTLAPFMLHFLSNFEVSPSKIFSLSKEAPPTIKIATIWLVFLIGTMQVFSEEIVILIISLIILITSYFFFILNRLAVSLTAISLFIHSAYSFLFTGIVFANLEQLRADFNSDGYDYSRLDVTLVNVFFFLLPGIISLIIAGNFYRKSVTGWVRSLYPDDEMEIEYYYVTNEEDEDDDENN